MFRSSTSAATSSRSRIGQISPPSSTGSASQPSLVKKRCRTIRVVWSSSAMRTMREVDEPDAGLGEEGLWRLAPPSLRLRPIDAPARTLEHVARGDRDGVLVVASRERDDLFSGRRVGRHDLPALREHALIRIVVSVFEPDDELVADEVLPGSRHLPQRLVRTRSKASLISKDLSAEVRADRK